MADLHLASVFEVHPDSHGVSVVFRDGVGSYRSTADPQGFVRVLVPRAHGHHGAAVSLPRPGELGVVAELEGLLVWLGALHWGDRNFIDPEPSLEMHRHDSGVQSRLHGDGRAEWSHPSGLRVTVSPDGSALPDLERNGTGIAPPGPAMAVPSVQVAHPAAGTLTLQKGGGVVLAHASGGTITITPAGELDFSGFAHTFFESAAAEFCMRPLLDWAKTHTHTGVVSGGGTSGQPSSQPPASSISPATFKGPTG